MLKFVAFIITCGTNKTRGDSEMFKILLFVIIIILICKYWKYIKVVVGAMLITSIAIFVSMFSIMFLFVTYIYHNLKTWHMLKKK